MTDEALAHLMVMFAGAGAADFTAADRHADHAAHIADRYDLPTAVAGVSVYRAMRAALDGDLTGAAGLYEQAAAAIDRLGMRGRAVGMSILGRFSVLVMGYRVADVAGELERLCSNPRARVVLAEPYALALAAAGAAGQARAVAGRAQPISLDLLWLFRTGIRGLLGIAIDDRERAESAYQALLPFAGRPAGAELMSFWPVAQILGDLARYLGLPGAQAYYQHALAIADQARVELWRAAALSRLN
jgi:hypothetical protein